MTNNLTMIQYFVDCTACKQPHATGVGPDVDFMAMGGTVACNCTAALPKIRAYLGHWSGDGNTVIRVPTIQYFVDCTTCEQPNATGVGPDVGFKAMDGTVACKCGAALPKSEAYLGHWSEDGNSTVIRVPASPAP